MPSRRQYLRTAVAGLPLFAGCAGDSSPGRTTSSATATSGTSTTTGATTRSGDPGLACDPEPLPESGWPGPNRSAGALDYAPAADGPTSTPSVEWSVESAEPNANDAAFTRPVVEDGRVFVGRELLVPPSRQLAGDHEMRAYDAATGDLEWRRTLPDRPEAVLTTESGVVVAHGDGVRGLAWSDGEQQWSASFQRGPQQVRSTPGGSILTTWWDEETSELRALDGTGGVKWRVPIDGEVGESLAWADGLAVLTTEGGAVVAVDATEASVAWRRRLQSGDDAVPGRVVTTPCAVFVAMDGVLYALDRAGEPVWHRANGARELAHDGELVYCLTSSGYVRAVDGVDGEPAWDSFHGEEERVLTDGFLDPPAVDGSTLYAGALDNKLVAAATDTGRERFVFDPGWEDEPRVSVAGDTLYASWGRRLVAFR